MSARIVPIAEPRQRRPRRIADAHLKWIRTLPCCVCLRQGETEAAHLRMAFAPFGKRETGKGEKPSDKWVTPLCTAHHATQHRLGEEIFWGYQVINPFTLALALYGMSGDDEAAQAILAEARKRT